MTRRFEISTIPGLLALALVSVLLPGCRAFDPEPIVVNQLPDTFITGGPVEEEGSRFRRHFYWYATDADGAVVRYIWAATDSLVENDEETDVDELDVLFDPADDVLTLEPRSWRTVGYTTKTDSVFVFAIDEGPTPSKPLIFHMVAVDDRGGVDPTPARLLFFDNSLGNPQFRFRVSTEEELPGGTGWFLRWVGSPAGPAPESPEQSDQPYVGFGRPFRIEWEASSPNGAVLGYRFKASQDPSVSFNPASVLGEKQWDASLTSFEYRNDVPPSQLPACNLNTGVNCPPESLRWPSGEYALNVEAIDEALVESESSAGALLFRVNYPPSTQLVTGPTYPYYQIVNAPGDTTRMSFAPGDTVPTRARIVFRSTGEDALPPVSGAEYDSFCCDVRLDPQVPEVRFQGQALMSSAEGGFTRTFQTLFSDLLPPDPQTGAYPRSDTLSFVSGPLDFVYRTRAVDEHRRPDLTPESFDFVAGFEPRMLSVSPSTGDTLALREPSTGQTWPGTYPYTVGAAGTRYWNGVQLVETDPSPGDPSNDIQGRVFRFKLRFEGGPDPRDPRAAIRAWTYSYFSEFDPSNSITDGPVDSKDLSFYANSPQPNVWEFGLGEELELFIPNLIWFIPSEFGPTSQNGVWKAVGAWLRNRMGEINLEVRGRTTALGQRYVIPRALRPSSLTDLSVDIGDLGRKTGVTEEQFHIYLKGVGGNPDALWPDF